MAIRISTNECKQKNVVKQEEYISFIGFKGKMFFWEPTQVSKCLGGKRDAYL